MRWLAWLRRTVLAAIVLVFLVSLLGILLTGPVVIRGTPTTLDIEGLGVSPARLRETVEILCNELSPRNDRQMARLNAAADWITKELERSGLAVETQEYMAGHNRFRNVIARREGSDPDAGVFVIGAHYDTYGDTVGADDNASGVAVLLELVRTLPPDHPRRTHLFVAFSTEEPPYFGTELMGSHVFARRLAARGTRVDAMIALDMVGYYSDKPGSQRFPFPGLGAFYPTRGNFIAVIGDAASGRTLALVKRAMMTVDSLPVFSFRAPRRWAPVEMSDHWSFRELGFPAVQVTDTAFMRLPHYHTVEDTPEKLDYERMARLVEALHGIFWEGRGDAPAAPFHGGNPRATSEATPNAPGD